MIRITDQYFWNAVFMLFYVALLVMAVIILDSVAYRSYQSLTPFDIVIVSLATFRFIRLFVYDGMTKFFREQFYDAVVAKDGTVNLYKPAHGPRRTLADLMTCPWCFGVWAATMILFFYLAAPWAYFPILMLAIAGIGSFLQITMNLIGHKAEQAKIDTERML